MDGIVAVVMWPLGEDEAAVYLGLRDQASLDCKWWGQAEGGSEGSAHQEHASVCERACVRA